VRFCQRAAGILPADNQIFRQDAGSTFFDSHGRDADALILIHSELFTCANKRQKALLSLEEKVFPRVNNIFVTFFTIFLVTPIHSDKFLCVPH
jgi:hypothetical protein